MGNSTAEAASVPDWAKDSENEIVAVFPSHVVVSLVYPKIW